MWTIMLNGEQAQVTLQRACELFQSGALKPDDLVFAPGGKKWHPAAAFQTELSAQVTASNLPSSDRTVTSSKNLPAATSVPGYVFATACGLILTLVGILVCLSSFSIFGETKGMPENLRVLAVAITVLCGVAVAGLGQLILAVIDSAKHLYAIRFSGQLK